MCAWILEIQLQQSLGICTFEEVSDVSELEQSRVRLEEQQFNVLFTTVAIFSFEGPFVTFKSEMIVIIFLQM